MVDQVREQQLYDELVGLCYEHALHATTWQPVLDRLAQACGHQWMFLVMHCEQQPSSTAVNADPCACAGIGQLGLPPGISALCLPANSARPAGGWQVDLIDFATNDQSQAAEQPLGLHNVASIRLEARCLGGLYLTALHQLSEPLPTAHHFALLERITPHLLKAIKLTARINSLKLDLIKRDVLLDHHTAPLWLLSGEGQVLHSNHAARQLCLSGSLLYEHCGHLCSSSQHERLRALIRIAADKEERRRRPGWLRLGAARRHDLLITPVPADAAANRSFKAPLVLLALLDHHWHSPLLAELFQLTPAEQRLGELLALGLTLEDCAKRLNVSINTVRTQLRALFRKTDTTRQAQLISLFTRLNGG
ncbi:helix-turn-helix transcriptional regulator [Pseudomonas sp. Teo4]|uniref:helix-turn-helix transcriptional regulator n=1 Tax=Pseudomonas sp. Teo4 TaxID=3064528 RepID=UPI002ABA4FAC|nr:helix-turn-helix transcriptional regulator [Pseudomonas sp. Teo4]MDZ3991678.1 hypothetical protein [Pseudomonas sp. Teo4]